MAEDRGTRVMRVDEKRLDGMTHHARHQGVAARIEAAAFPRTSTKSWNH